MKKLHFLCIFLLLLSCENKQKKPPVDLSDSTTKKVDTLIVPLIQTEEKESNDSSEVEIPSLQQNIVKPHKFYEGLLEDFCKKYYHKKFPGRTYIYGSIRVETTRQTDANTVEVKGLHSFKGRLGIKTYNNKEFRATVRSENNSNFHIKFDRRLVKPISGGGEWVSTGDLPFTYNP